MANDGELAAPWQLLGPIRLVHRGSDITFAPGKQQCVLVALLLTPGQSVPVEVLVKRVWGDRPPRSGNPVAPHVARLRRVLAASESCPAGTHDHPGVLSYSAGGYRIDCHPDSVDLHRARRQAAAARTAAGAADHRRASELLGQALTGWRPTALAGVPGEWAERIREGLAHERLDLVARLADAKLRLGRHQEVAEELRPLVAEHPTGEGLVAPLLLALAGSGRVAEALDCYAYSRERIAADLGCEPSQPLRDLHMRLLRGERQVAAGSALPRLPRQTSPANTQPAPPPADAGRSASPHDAGPGQAAPAVPAQLPADIPVFIGRAEHLARLDALLADVASGGRAAVVIAALYGTAGVGKTALAVHWAHRAAARFPGGQLYANLRGFGGDEHVMAPAEAVRGFLDALGVPPERIPPSLDQQTALYRSLLAGKRTLVVLDNARDADQVRPLLPGSASLVLVTSRDQLTPLVAAQSARPFSLGTLSTAEARELLASRMGADRVAAEPGAAGQIIAACARLPLALTIAAARAQQTGFSLAAIAAELASASQSLDMMDAGDASGQLRAVLSWSYATLTPAAAQLFRLLGLRPGPDISAAAAASLGGHTGREARLLLTELTRASLLTEHLPARYSCHDLLHAYAAELTHAHDSPQSRRAAAARLLDHYLHTAYRCDRLLREHRDQVPVPLSPPVQGACPERPADRQHARAWLTAEHRVLLAAVELASEAGFDTRCWQLAWVLHSDLTERGHWDDLVTTWQIALGSARRLGDTAAQATAHSELAAAQIQQGRHADGRRQLSQAFALHAEAGDVVGQAHIHCHLMSLWMRQERYTNARDHAHQMLVLFLAAGRRRGEARALNNLGWCHAHLGDTARALDSCRQGISLFQQLGDHDGEASTWDTLGRAHHLAGAFTDAVGCFQRALEVIRGITSPHTEAAILTHLGDAHQGLADSSAAHAVWDQALAILTSLDHPEAGELRAKLSSLDRETA